MHDFIQCKQILEDHRNRDGADAAGDEVNTVSLRATGILVRKDLLLG